MADKNSEFLKLKQDIKNKNIKNLYLFFGEEIFIKDTYMEIMENLVPKDDFSDFNRIFIDGKDLDIERIDDSLDSFPVMAEKKLVVIKNSGIFKLKDSEVDASVRSYWQERLKSIPDFVLLVFDEQEVDKRSATYKSVSKYGLCVEFNYLNDYELVAWIVREAGKNNKKISKESAEYLLSLCDPGISNIKNELDKLIDYCDNEIYRSDIEKVVSKPISVVIFDITDAIIKHNSDTAVEILLRLKENKTSAFNVLYLLSSNFDKMLHAKLLLENSATYDMIASKLKVSPYIAKKYIENSKNFSKNFLIERINQTAEIDFKIKLGEVDDWTALMQYVFNCIK